MFLLTSSRRCSSNGYSRSQAGTIENYLWCARKLAAFHRRSPAEMGEPEVRRYLLRLVDERRIGPAGHKMHVAAIKFLYGITLGRPEVAAQVPWPKVPVKPPDILNGDEVAEVLEAIASSKHRAILMTAYGAGLRISEACALRGGDFPSAASSMCAMAGGGATAS